MRFEKVARRTSLTYEARNISTRKSVGFVRLVSFASVSFSMPTKFLLNRLIFSISMKVITLINYIYI